MATGSLPILSVKIFNIFTIRLWLQLFRNTQRQNVILSLEMGPYPPLFWWTLHKRYIYTIIRVSGLFTIFNRWIYHMGTPVIPLASTKLKRRVYWFHLVRLSICPSVDKIVSALYFQQYSSDQFNICTSYQATSEGVLRVMFVSKFWRIL